MQVLVNASQQQQHTRTTQNVSKERNEQVVSIEEAICSLEDTPLKLNAL